MHNKPIVLMNVDGYWDPLIALMDHIIKSGFADKSLRDLFTVKADASDTAHHISAQLS